jgi:hypothetical protein
MICLGKGVNEEESLFVKFILMVDRYEMAVLV